MIVLKVASQTAAAMALLTPYGYADDAAPVPPPVRPVSPGSRVDDQVAPVKLDEATLVAIREIVRQSIAQAQPSPQAPQYAPAPSPQSPPPVQYAPAPAVYQQPVQYQAPVTPVVMMKHQPWHKQALGRFGARLSSLGAPVVTQGVIQTSYQQVQTVQMVQQQSIPVATAVQPVPTVQVQFQQPVWSPSPQAPRK